LNWPIKLGPTKTNSSCKFSQWPIKKHLNRIHISLWLGISLWLVAPPQGGKAKHHWGSRRNKCQVATLYDSCANLSNGK
jgi:hypothetical protein